MYKIERLEAEISVDKYIDEYVNVEEFLECCQACPNYEKKWSCPPYDFDVIEYWKQFKTLYVLGYKIVMDEEVCQKTYTDEEIKSITNDIFLKEKLAMSKELYIMEENFEGSVSLSAGSCHLCGDDDLVGNSACTRANCTEGTAREHCKHYDQMRYSIESLGGNVGKTCSKLMRDEIEWIEEGKMPGHFLLVGGLLRP